MNLLYRFGDEKMIVVNLDVIMAKRKISSSELAEKLDITPANLSILKTNKGKAIRFSTLDKLCNILDCTPGDILEYKEYEKWNDWNRPKRFINY